MSKRMGFTILITTLLVIFVGWLFARGNGVNNQAIIDSMHDGRYVQSVKTTSFYGGLALILWALLMIATWGKVIGKRLSHVSLLVLLLAGCGIGPVNTEKIIEPNQIAFVVPITGDNAYQGEVNGDVNYWKGKEKPNVTAVTIGQSWFQQGFLSGYWRDDSRVIVVSVAAVNRKFTTATLDAATCTITDAGNGFAVEDLDSHGIFMGAVITAHISPTDAPLFLASYGDRPLEDDDTSKQSIMDNEVKNFIQSQLFSEVGKRTLNQVRAEKDDIFAAVYAHTRDWFTQKGISIDTIGGTDGLVYENCDIQKQIDASFARSEQQNQTQFQATNQAILNHQLVDQSYAQATATSIAAHSDAESIKLRGDALAANQQLIQQDAVQRWNGQLPQVMDSNSSLPFIGQALTTPPAPASTDTP